MHRRLLQTSQEDCPEPGLATLRLTPFSLSSIEFTRNSRDPQWRPNREGPPQFQFVSPPRFRKSSSCRRPRQLRRVRVTPKCRRCDSPTRLAVSRNPTHAIRRTQSDARNPTNAIRRTQSDERNPTHNATKCQSIRRNNSHVYRLPKLPMDEL